MGGSGLIYGALASANFPQLLQDIYEATEFNPQAIAYGDTIASDKICKYLVKILIHQSSITFQNM